MIAVQRPGQVVLAPVGAFTRLPMGSNDVLHPSPGLRRDEPFVVAVELDAFPGDGGLVVRVVEDLAEFLRTQWSCRPLGSRPLRQPADLEFGRQLPQAPVAGA